MFHIYDGRTAFWQWDLGQRLVVGNEICCEVHFCNKTDDCALVCTVYEKSGQRVVDVPNILLQTAATVRVYAYGKNDTENRTLYEMRFQVLPRTKPADYVYTETEVKSYETLEQRLSAIEEAISPIKYVVGVIAPGNPSLQEFETGTYVLSGDFYYNRYNNHSVSFNDQYVTISHDGDYTYLAYFDAKGRLVHTTLQGSQVYTKYIDLGKLETTARRVTAIDETADDNHYPTARAVFDYVGNIEAALDELHAYAQNLIAGGAAE